MIAEIIVDVKNKQVNRSFDYLIPRYLLDIIKIGSRVKVPFGKQTRTGFVINIKDSTDSKKELKEISDTIDVKRVLNEEFVNIAKYIAENNFTFYATALETMIPTALKIKYQKIVKVINKDLLIPELKELFKSRNELIIDNQPLEKRELIYKNIDNKNLILDTKISKNRNDKYEEIVHFENNGIIPKTPKQRGLYEYLEELNEDIELNILIEDSGYSKLIIKSLEELGAISIYKREIEPEIKKVDINYKKVDLNKKQKEVISSIKLNSYDTYLLHGVTGSGKTEVYMKLIEKCLDENKGAIMLVPEISLTPQITSLFKNRFGDLIAILHSRLSIKDKYDEWKRIINNDVKIVVGARSAIFAPLNNLGIVIIDECHESSYRQTNNPKYNTIDIAKERAIINNCPLILGSATPKINDYFMALNRDYNLITLPTRANKLPLPKIRVADMREELKKGNRSVLSEDLKESMAIMEFIDEITSVTPSGFKSEHDDCADTISQIPLIDYFVPIDPKLKSPAEKEIDYGLDNRYFIQTPTEEYRSSYIV